MKILLIIMMLCLYNTAAMATTEITASGGASVTNIIPGTFCEYQAQDFEQGLSHAEDEATQDAMEKCQSEVARVSEFEIKGRCTVRGAIYLLEVTANYRCL